MSGDLQPGAARAADVDATSAACRVAAAPEAALLEVRNLAVRFRLPQNDSLCVVNDLSYSLRRGKTLAIVGESGAGKSVSCRALIGLLPDSAAVTGSVRYEGRELLGLPESQIRRHRGASIAMVFQDADQHLNPTMRVGEQIAEAIQAHQRADNHVARERSVALLERLGLPAPDQCFRSFPHQISGGMRQRAMIAIALACNPKVLIADESTRSVDNMTRAQVLSLLAELQRETGMGLILVTHDLAVAERFSDDLLVMRAGEQVEHGPTSAVFAHPFAPYTRTLLMATPGGKRSGQGGSPAVRSTEPADPTDPLLTAKNLVQEFTMSRRGFHADAVVHAITDISFDLRRGETLGVIGESGAGKSTLARALLQEPRPTSGEVSLRGQDLTCLTGRKLRDCRRRMQVVLQDAVGSLNPRWRVAEIVEEPLRRSGEWGRAARRSRVQEMLELVGLPAQRYANRRPRELSGGQCQRVAIARALAPNPEVIIFDEAVSSLDTLVQAQVLDLMRKLRAQLGLSYLFITHDLAVVQNVADRVAVLHRGQMCEIGGTATVFQRSLHPYTRALLTSALDWVAPAVPEARPAEFGLPVASPDRPVPGCRYYASCAHSQEQCAKVVPRLRPIGTDHMVACHFPLVEAVALAEVS